MLTYNLELDMVPGGNRVEVPIKQYSDAFVLNIYLFARTGHFSIESV